MEGVLLTRSWSWGGSMVLRQYLGLVTGSVYHTPMVQGIHVGFSRGFDQI
jgi:hypothetical protein